MPSRKQTRRSISVSQDYYVAFAASCAQRGVSMSQVTERLISAHLAEVGTPSAESMKSVRERIGKVGKGARPPHVVERIEKIRSVARQAAAEPMHATPIVDRLAQGRTHVPATEYDRAIRAVKKERRSDAAPPKTIRSRADRIAEDSKQVRRTVIEAPAPAGSGRPGPTKPSVAPDRGSFARLPSF